MKASEVLQLYQAGERNFQHVNLRGQSFRKANLADADFSYADIRGANFAEANLTGTKFIKAKAGLQKRWAIGLIIYAFLATSILALFKVFVGFYIADIFSKSGIEYTVGGGLAFIILGLCYRFLFRQGISSGGTVALYVLLCVVLGVALPIALPIQLPVILPEPLPIEIYVLLSLVISMTFYVAFSLTLYLVLYLIIPVGIVVVPSALMCIVLPVRLNENSSLTPIGIAIAITYSLITLVLNMYLAYRTHQGDERDVWVRGVSIAVASTGGTKFYNANLTEANFSQAIVKNTNFRNAILTRTNFHQAKKLDFTRAENTILAATSVRKLLVDGNGAKQDYTNTNLRGANLDGANLEAAILKNADLSEASLVNANLQAANLTEVQAVGTNFTQARLTGACLEAWNIDSTTKLKEIDCLWVYLAEKERENSNQWGERRPSSGNFQPGEFTKLFTEILDTVDLIFENGVDWKAFVTAFDKVRIENEDLDLTIRSIENLDDGMTVIKVNVPPDADKEKIHSTFKQNYQHQLQEVEEKYKAMLAAKDEKIISIYREKSSEMYNIAGLLASNQPNFNIDNKAMNNSEDNSQNISVGGNFNIDADNSVVNLRDISGKVSNTIQQLPETTSDTPGIKELLTQLQTAIDDETELSDKDKAKALRQVNKLAAAGENPQANQDDADDSLTMLKGIVSGLQETAKLVTTCQEIIPLLTGLFGLG